MYIPQPPKRGELIIIQPRKIGDVVICLPIAHYYKIQGWDVMWPIDAAICPMFDRAVPYVNWVPVLGDNELLNELAKPEHADAKVLNLAFGFKNDEFTKKYLGQNDMSFDELKYHIAGVPFANKWNLRINRDWKREKVLYDKLVKQDDYVGVHQWSSDMARPVDLTQFGKHQVIEISSITDSIFDWLKIIEGAKLLVAVESCMSNLVDQLGIKVPKVLLEKHGYYSQTLLKDGRLRGMPVLREKWVRL